jgi:hypothetical protein
VQSADIATAERYRAYAKAWLHYEIRRGDASRHGPPWRAIFCGNG